MNRTEALKEIRDIYKEHFDDYDPQTNMIAAIIEEALQSEPETGESVLIDSKLIEINRSLKIQLRHLRAQNNSVALSITNIIADIDDVIRQLK